MTAWDSAVLEDHWFACKVFHDNVHIPLVEKVGGGGTTGHPRNAQSRACLFTGVAKRSVLLVQFEHLGFFIACAGPQRVYLRVDVPGSHNEIQPAIIIGIEEDRSPFHIWKRRQGDT